MAPYSWLLIVAQLAAVAVLFQACFVVADEKVEVNRGKAQVAGVQCIQGALRLVGGRSRNEGRVELCNKVEWGTVCDDWWDYRGAGVVCRQLGFSSSGAVAYGNAKFGEGNGPIWLDLVHCTGSEPLLINCSHSPILDSGIHSCLHSEDAGVQCQLLGGCIQGALRLVTGLIPFEGRVELCNNGQWGTVCDDDFGAEDARVVCRQLGLRTSDATPVSTRSRSAAGNSRPIWLDQVHCRGNESHLKNCSASPIGINNCDHREDVRVRCSVCHEGAVKLVGGRLRYYDYEGRVELCNQGRWGTVCDNSWDSADARVVCQQLGLPTNAAAVAVPRAGFDGGFGPIWLNNVSCRGSETRLSDCPESPIGTHNCEHKNDAGVVCLSRPDCKHGDIRLSSPSFRQGRVDFCNQGIWGSVCDDGMWSIQDAIVACRQLGFAPIMSGNKQVSRLARPDSSARAGRGPIWLANVHCRGTEAKLMDCPANPIGSNNCHHNQDAGVLCYSDEPFVG